jgi:hypothetical protein
MPIGAYAVLALLAALSAFAAQRLAVSQGRNPLPWVVAAVSFGPFPLIPLALLSKRDV